MTLTPEHLRELVEGSGISVERAERVFDSIHDPKLCAKATGLPISVVKGYVPFLQIKYFYLFGGTDDYKSRFKPAKPIELRKNGDTSSAKYLTPGKSDLGVYYPTLSRESSEWLSDVSIDIGAVEGEKKAESAAEAGFIVLAIPGVNNWHRKGEKSLHPAFAPVKWEGRRVFIYFDRDALTNVRVQTQEEKLAQVLLAKGARVFVVRFPEDAQKLDDYLVKYGREGLLRLQAEAREIKPEEREPVAVPSRGKQLTDAGNAEKLVLRNGARLRYISQQRKWLFWDGKCWRLDETGLLLRLAIGTVRSMYAEASKIEDGATRDALVKHARASEAHPRLKAMIELAGSQSEVACRASDFDKDPWLLNTPSGIVDLKTGKLLPHDPQRLLSKITSVEFDPNAKCPTWDRFVLQVMGGNAELAAYCQRAAGYSLTGSVREHCLFFLYGDGANGKGTFINTIVRLLGSYAAPGAADLLLEKRNEAHPTALADLWGLRLVSVQEVKDGAWDEATVKGTTGGDPIKARRMREDFWWFEPTHKQWVSGNHKPRVRGTDDGIWRRIRLIPFTRSFKGCADKLLAEKLIAEGPGILAWAVRGCLAWQRDGLAEPAIVLDHTEAYRRESDSMGQFLLGHCVFSADARVTKNELRKAYQEWAEERGDKPVGAKRFAEALRARSLEAGVEARETNMRVGLKFAHGWAGVRLMNDGERAARCGGVAVCGGDFQDSSKVVPLKRDNLELTATTRHTATRSNGAHAVGALTVGQAEPESRPLPDHVDVDEESIEEVERALDERASEPDSLPIEHEEVW